MIEARGLVFVADDNRGIREGIALALCRHGYAVRTAADGEELLRLLEQSEDPPDLLLLDMAMPRLSGAEVIGALRGDARWALLPVLLISAHARASPAPGGAAVTFLPKPFRLRELLAHVGTILGHEPAPAAAGA